MDSIPEYLKLDDELTGDFTEVSMSLPLKSLSLPVNSRQVGDCLGGCVGDVGGCFGDIGGFIGDAVGSIGKWFNQPSWYLFEVTFILNSTLPRCV